MMVRMMKRTKQINSDDMRRPRCWQSGASGSNKSASEQQSARKKKKKTAMSKQEDTQRKVISIARKIEAVQASLSAFDFEGQQYLPKAVAQAILDTEYSFAHRDYARALHMCEVTAFLVSYYKTKHLSAGPEKWIARWHELNTPPTRPTKPTKPGPVVMKRVPL